MMHSLQADTDCNVYVRPELLYQGVHISRLPAGSDELDALHWLAKLLSMQGLRVNPQMSACKADQATCCESEYDNAM